MNPKRERRTLIIAGVVIVVIIACALLVLISLFFGVSVFSRGVMAPVGSGGGVVAVTAVAPATGWQTYTDAELGLSLDYPADWYVHAAGKALQITPNAQPTWSSFFDPDEPHGGPTFDLLHNLNREMGPTPLAEVENIVASYGAEAEIAAISGPASLPDRADVVVGVYRFTVDGDEQVLLVGAAVNPLPDSPQPVIAMVGLVDPSAQATMQPIFEDILRSLRPNSALSED